ncbi:MAG: response regulator [Chloroflexi bacterium]|nr:response regulator [Chloroflexota bacterium]
MKISDSPLILVVDDDAYAARRVEKTLVPQGYDIIIANDGAQALARAAETPPDLVVLDVLMPELDGYDTAQALRARAESRAIPILMVTALNDLEDKVKGLESGADDFLSKPFNTVELIARVRSLLRIKQLHDQLQARNTLLERLLTRYVSEQVAHEILLDPGQDLHLDGQSCEVSVLFANIRGFTHFSEQLEAAQVTQTLNYIFHHLATAVFEHQGTLDKYLGDAIMAFYGAPIPSADYSVQALRTAWTMQRRFGQLCREDPVLSKLGIGIGLSTGEAVVGNIGAKRMVDYTVLGHTPNTAQRLQSYAKKDQILMDERTYQAVREIANVRPVELPNLDQSAPIYEVLAVKEPTRI